VSWLQHACHCLAAVILTDLYCHYSSCTATATVVLPRQHSYCRKPALPPVLKCCCCPLSCSWFDNENSQTTDTKKSPKYRYCSYDWECYTNFCPYTFCLSNDASGISEYKNDWKGKYLLPQGPGPSLNTDWAGRKKDADDHPAPTIKTPQQICDSLYDVGSSTTQGTCTLAGFS
jgi:hypothetical protein